MGRFGSTVVAGLIFLFLSFSLGGCSGGGSSTKVVNYPVPASIGLTPATNASITIGSTLSFTASPKTNAGTAISEPVAYHSSNPAVLTIAANGTACAGTWDSLTSPTVCTPGPTGTAQVYATALGISSPNTTVYVHQQVDSVVVSIAPVNLQTNPVPTACYEGMLGYSKGLPAGGQQFVTLQATAMSHGVDITSTVGQFSWSAQSSGTTGVVTLSSVPLTNPPTLNQQRVTANIPGLTSIYASVDGVNSAPYPYLTCPINSIVLSVTGNTGTSTSITATAYDSNPTITNPNGLKGFPVTGIPLTWTSSQPLVAKVTGSSASTIYAGTATTSQGTTGGTATIIASCTPPTCNVGLAPTLPIYPKDLDPTSSSGILNVTSTPTTGSSTATLYVTSSDCGTIDSCFTKVLPVTATLSNSGNGATFTVGNPINLATTSAGSGVTPDSLVFEPQGTKAYLGTDSGNLGAKGLQVLTVSGNSVNHFTSTPGKVLAVSPDNSKVIVSDTIDSPNQVYIFSPASGSSVPLIPTGVTGAVAAAFSPDNLKAFIVTNTGKLYVYSTLDALQAIDMVNPGTDVSFFPQGSFAYIGGGTPSGPVTARRTCDNTVAQTISTPGQPTFIRALPNGSSILAVDSPGIDLIDVTSFSSDGCSPNVTNSVTSYNFGQGNFTPVQVVVSEDSSTVYIVADDSSGQHPLPFVFEFNVNAKTFSQISLAGSAIPLQVALTQNGRYLFVGAHEQVNDPVNHHVFDPTIHILDMTTGTDIQQLVLTKYSTVPICVGAGSPAQDAPVTCYPTLMAVAP
ncbi:MAG: hypothetical protein JWO91_3509 [Acidobacteriaceae bacterium]|jgi:hypothetical protein|nr:hypothetical protein [Acidobacteriaceae bacterium]